jgi:chromosome segregation ATPase
MSDDPKPEGNEAETSATEATTKKPEANVSSKTPEPAKGQDWESAYKGLQRKYDKLFDEHNQLLGTENELNASIEELKQQVRTATTEKDQISIKNVEASEKIEGLQSQVNAFNATIERQKLIMSDYQDLAPFEAKGLLPSAQTEEEMRSVFDSFRETLGSQVQTATDEKVKGIGTGKTEPKEPKPLDADQIYNEMQSLAGTNDPEKRRRFEQLQSQWMDLNEG